MMPNDAGPDRVRVPVRSEPQSWVRELASMIGWSFAWLIASVIVRALIGRALGR